MGKKCKVKGLRNELQSAAFLLGQESQSREGKERQLGTCQALQASSDFSPAVGPLGEGEASLGGLLREEEEPGESSWDSLCTQAGPSP